MISFKKITYQNFMSTGNKPIELLLNDSKITVVSGKNGHGKSSLSSAIYYALYGKAFNKVNLSSLINSVNKKALLVTLELDVNGTSYIVKRGMKPNIFEVYVNGKLKPQPANVKDYQKWLIDNVLRMDERTFRQVVTMGSTSFVPFMKLGAADRRVVIEDLLNIDVISKMNVIAKSRAKMLESSKSDYEHTLFTLEKEYEATQQSIEAIKTSIEENIQRINTQLKDLKERSSETVNELDTLKEENDPKLYSKLSSDLTSMTEAISKLKKLSYKKELDLKSVNENLAFFTEKTICPTCTQPFAPELVREKTTEAESQKQHYEDELKQITEYLTSLEEGCKSTQDKLKALYEIQQKIANKYAELEQYKQKFDFYLQEKKAQTQKLESIKPQEGLSEVKKQIEETNEHILILTSHIKSYETIFALLKDDGIKTVIIKNYLGIINALIKKFLNVINFNVSFMFDSNFNETIKSRGRDVFEYNCFSEGERLRIDYCILFTFRELARLRSTVNTNLLIIDEQDGRLDTEGVTAVNTLLSSMTGNTIIISQYADSYDDIATKHVVMKKDNHFTQATIL